MKKKLLILGGIGATSVLLLIYFSKANRYKRCSKRAEKIISGIPTSELFDSTGAPTDTWKKYSEAVKKCETLKPKSNVGPEMNTSS